VSDQIIYEHPLNERIRTLLRLEHLFDEAIYYLPLPDEWGSRSAIDSLLKIASIFTRADIKSEILKELDRQLGKLGSIRRQPGVDMQTLGQVLDELERANQEVHRINGQVGQQLRENEFLKSIMQRTSIPGGSCAFDLPQFHYWLQQPPAARQQQMQEWYRELEPIRDAIGLLLSLTRNSTRARPETAFQGFFQKTLDAQTPPQLLRIGVSTHLPLFAEISGGRHRFSVRFMEASPNERPSQCQRDVQFSLACCAI
jgi:cell division protein ZapD